MVWGELTAAERLRAAQGFLYGTDAPLGEMCALAFALKDNDKRFTHARRLLVRVVRHDEFATLDPRSRRKVHQQLALCTYKDDDLPADRRFNRALEWIKQIAPLEQLNDQESLCLVGTIFKRQWEATGQMAYLRRSLAFYQRGHAAAPATGPDYDGYAAINAAFMYDLLALEESKTDPHAQVVQEYRLAAQALRAEIVTELPPKARDVDPDDAWWMHVTIAEAFLGLRRYDEARAALELALRLPKVYAWQQEATARQFASLAHIAATLDESSGPQAFQIIETAFDLSKEAREAMAIGRFGVALSGGGFRASLFHIGVLARLAELDLLRHVEVLSCVSGGSIIGTYYYLELRSRMLEKADREMTQEEYVKIVKRIEQQFLEGVQTNLRSSLPTSIWSNLRMLVDPGYSRTTRIGDLYQERLFNRIPPPAVDGGTEPLRPKWISELPFRPKDAQPEFNPKSHNWKRGAKVPMIVINATTLNTGRNWQFTGTWMGEPARTVDDRVDSNDYLRRMYYSEAPQPYRGRGIPLGHAVAASSCVPGLFPALKLPNLFMAVPIVRLVDGGVHDNQGIGALLDQDCNVMFVSDASGQIRNQANPPGGMFGGPSRSNSVLQARVRLAQYRELDARKRSGAVRDLTWVHLRQDFEPRAIDWVECEEPFWRDDERPGQAQTSALLRYGVHRDMQAALARLRTDLDAFSDAEAHALMCSAYQMTSAELADSNSAFAGRRGRPEAWAFLAVSRHLESGSFETGVARVIQVGERLPLKVWRLRPELRVLGSVGLFIIALALVSRLVLLVARIGWVDAAATVMKSPSQAVLGVIATVAMIAAVRLGFQKYGRVGELLERGTVGVLMVVLFIPMWVQRTVFDPLFLASGKYKRRE